MKISDFRNLCDAIVIQIGTVLETRDPIDVHHLIRLRRNLVRAKLDRRNLALEKRQELLARKSLELIQIETIGRSALHRAAVIWGVAS